MFKNEGLSMVDEVLLGIMPESNIFSIKDWKNIFNIELVQKRTIYRDSFLKVIEDFLKRPCPFVQGKTIAETHCCFCYPTEVEGRPLTLESWDKFYSNGNKSHLVMNFNHLEVSNPGDPLGLGWTVMFKGIIPNSINLGIDDQKKLLNGYYRMSQAVEAVMMNFLFFEKNKELINRTDYGRVIDTVNNISLSVGCFNHPGKTIGVSELNSSEPEEFVGIFASCK